MISHPSMDEVNRMLANGTVCWLERNGKIIGVGMVKPPQQSREYSNEASYGGGMIRMTEIEANACGERRVSGVNRYEGTDPMIIGNFVDHAMSKIEAWPLVGDDKAVRVAPNWCRIR